jgi:hypothetical protein
MRLKYQKITWILGWEMNDSSLSVLTPSASVSFFAGELAGGGLTIIANAPHPAGVPILE